MACGTGKTLVGNQIAESIGNRSLCCVPSIALIAQNLRSWRQNGDTARYKDVLIVCSDTSVVSINADQPVVSPDEWRELGATVTTDPKVIAEYLGKPDKYRTVFSTYQSTPVIVETLKIDASKPFDITICDEAHRAAGREESVFTTI